MTAQDTHKRVVWHAGIDHKTHKQEHTYFLLTVVPVEATAGSWPGTSL